MVYSKFIILVLFLASIKIINNKCDEIHQTFNLKEIYKKFIQIVNSIPTIEQNLNQIPDSDVIIMLDLIERGVNGTKPASYQRKLLSLSCTYGHVTLYILYHLIDMQGKGQSIEETFLDYYRECMHHMLQVLYLTDSFADREMWYVAITLDAFVRHKLDWSSINFKKMGDLLIGSLTQRCVPDQLLESIPVYERLAGQFDFVSYNRQLGFQLMLSKGHQLFMTDVYRGDEQFEIYQFVWNDNKNYKIFTPPKSWFKSYDDTRMRKAYEVVLQSWKSDFYSLQKYTDSARNLVLTVTYYALLLHCHYLQMTWYIVFERVKSVSLPSEQESMQNEAIALLRIPLSLVDNILQNVHYSEDMEYLKDITCNLTYDENADRTAFNKFVDRLLDRYNFYASQFDMEHMDHPAMKKKFSVPNQFNLSTLNTSLLEFTEILDSYYDTVKRALSPTNFFVIEYFTSTKPVGVNIETPQDLIQSLTKITLTEYEQDLETYINLLRILNRIPTLDKIPKRITIPELDAMIDNANEEQPMKSMTPESYQRKVGALNCAYVHAALYMFYHMLDLYNNDRMDKINFYLHRYKKCVHRLMSVMYASKGFIFPNVWFVVIAFDSFRHSTMDKDVRLCNRMVMSLLGSIKICREGMFITELFRTYDELVEKGPYDFAAHNDQLLSKLMLSAGNEGFMMKLYHGGERFNIFQFIWNDNRVYRKFAPPACWFPLYKDNYLRRVNEDVVTKWRESSYIINRYKEAVVNLVMMVTYYALLLHFHYLEISWSSITRQVKFDDLAAWVRIPLPLLKLIFRDLNILEDNMNLIEKIENNLSKSDETDRITLNIFINRLLVRYNSYTTQLELKGMDYSTMKRKFSVPDRLELSALERKLLEVVDILNDYYETVKQTLSPTTLHVIESFTSTKRKEPIHNDTKYRKNLR